MNKNDNNKNRNQRTSSSHSCPFEFSSKLANQWKQNIKETNSEKQDHLSI